MYQAPGRPPDLTFPHDYNSPRTPHRPVNRLTDAVVIQAGASRRGREPDRSGVLQRAPARLPFPRSANEGLELLQSVSQSFRNQRPKGFDRKNVLDRIIDFDKKEEKLALEKY
jgi:hypothetical protein